MINCKRLVFTIFISLIVISAELVFFDNTISKAAISFRVGQTDRNDTPLRNSSRRKVRKKKTRTQVPSKNNIPSLPAFEIPYDPDLPAKRVVVLPFTNAVPELDGHINAETGLTAQLISELMKCKNFIVLDRSVMGVLKDELMLAQSGAVTKETAASAGKVLGAQVIIKGVVTEFTEQAYGTAGENKIDGGQIASVIGQFTDSKAVDAVEAADPEIGGGNETITGVVGLDLQLIDVNTNSVISTFTARGTITRDKSSRCLGIAGFTTSSASFQNTVIGQATRLAIRDAVIQIFLNMKKVKWQGMVAAVKPDGLVIINAGLNQNLRSGQTMSILAEGEKITDPATGLTLYVEHKKIATIKIVSLRENICFAEVLSGGNIQRGDIVELE